MDAAPEWIGLDVGGSGVRAAKVERGEDGWSVLGELHELSWDDGFRPVPLDEQLAYPGQVTAEEEVCGAQRVARIAELVAGCAASSALRLAVAAPGLVTEDGAGILAWRNGPRRSTFLVDLERSLLAIGASLVAPPASICPDSVACALGEHGAESGALRGVSNALCISGGSGVGEAALVKGRCLGLDELEPPLPRAWEIGGGDGRSLEDRVAPGRVLGAWHEAGKEGCPEDDDGEQAMALCDARDEGIAALVERARSWFDGGALALERVAVCQTLGGLLARDPERLAALAARLDGVELVTSAMRAAPVIGAVVRAEERVS